MKRHIMIGLLTMLVLIPAVEVFSAPSFVTDFPYAANGTQLTFTLHVTNLLNTPLQITIITVPSGQPASSHPFTINPFVIFSYGPTDVGCPANVACRLVVVYPGGATPAFGALLEIDTTAGPPVGYVAPTFTYTTQ